MSRKLAPKEVVVITHGATRTQIPLMLDRQELTFFAKVGDVRFDGKTAAEVKKALFDYLDENVKMDWIPVIEAEISCVEIFSRRRTVSLTADRYYLAEQMIKKGPRIEKAVFKLEWDDYKIDKERFRYRDELNPV